MSAPTCFEKATALAGFKVERAGAELTYTPEIQWKSTVTDEEKQADWYIDSALDERIEYTARVGDHTMRLYPKSSATQEWVLLESTPTCGLMADARPGSVIEAEIVAQVPIGKKLIKTKHVLMRGSFECPDQHSVMSSPGYTIMDTDTNKLMMFLSIADVDGAIKIVSMSLHCNIENGLW